MDLIQKYRRKSYQDFHIPIDDKEITLKDALEAMNHSANNQNQVPFIVQLVENPKYNLPFIDIFKGAVNLLHHDCIHLILGRGMLPKDEAFVIGFTMGSTNKVNIFERFLFKFITKYIYPKPWNFTDEDLHVLSMGISLGKISKVRALDTVDFKLIESLTLEEIRNIIGLETEMIKEFYKLEEILFPNSKESQRIVKKDRK